MKRILAVVAAVLFFGMATKAEMTNDLSDKEIQGRTLAQKILQQWPSETFSNTGVLKIKGAKSATTNVPVIFEALITPTNWQAIYTASVPFPTNGNPDWARQIVAITHAIQLPNEYEKDDLISFGQGGFASIKSSTVPSAAIRSVGAMIPFAGSDFSLADLGLEFFHWPAQKVLKREVHSSRGCTVLESTNPNPSTNSYSRVVSWIDTDTLGIVEAYAYDTKGKQIKDFYPKDFKKVDGKWQVQTLVMENVQTGSRSRLEFDLKK